MAFSRFTTTVTAVNKASISLGFAEPIWVGFIRTSAQGNFSPASGNRGGDASRLVVSAAAGNLMACVIAAGQVVVFAFRNKIFEIAQIS
jgi:hypothetical protein